MSRYDYAKPLAMRASAETDMLLLRLVETAAFRRLKDVRFLGGIDYVLVPAPNGQASNTRYTRYQHSIGVACLALSYAGLRELPLKERRLATAAALLHDIGHAPLSHSLEPVFEEAFGLNHHAATAEIILGHHALGGEVATLLREHGVDPAEVVEVIAGRHDPFEGFFSGPINFDTIEGILRSRSYLKPSGQVMTPDSVLESAVKRDSEADRRIVDRFWNWKDEVYRYLIRSERGVFADHICQYVAGRSLRKLSRADYFASERDLFRKLPEIRRLLLSRAARQSEALPDRQDLPYKQRRFIVDPDGDFFAREDRKRYRQEKTDGVLSLPQLSGHMLAAIEAEMAGGAGTRDDETLF